MKKTIILLFFAIISALTNAKSLSQQSSLCEKGVSLELAISRKQSIKETTYDLSFDIPKDKNSLITGKVSIGFKLDEPQDVVIDYAEQKNITAVSVPFRFENEHIIIPSSAVRKGINNVDIAFNVDDRWLNRRDDFLYTLSVPDKARRLFPCFDQPDMKALYSLQLLVPKDWKAVSNGKMQTASLEHDRMRYKFSQTEPLSTYLFAFVAGKFTEVSSTHNNRTISIYHKETDQERMAQCDEIFRQVFASLEWLEEYTGISYPFAKYDVIILPGFQFGGMEHTGATLYNDKSMFLNKDATLDEKLARTSLIAHETAHMWFGDYVTMEWFSDVWTKEVFANYFASCIVEPLYPEVNHRLKFVLGYAPAAYSEDRTLGTNPIQQNLSNLQDAGLVYGNIIYTKSPLVMDMLVRKIGKDTFRKGIQHYLNKYAYGNATWDKLIKILDSLSEEDLAGWSKSWVHEKGMPSLWVVKKGARLIIKQDSLIRSQRVSFKVDESIVEAQCDMPETVIPISMEAKLIVPNYDGAAYGYFSTGKSMLKEALTSICQLDEVGRGITLINSYEALLRNDIEPNDFNSYLIPYLLHEKNPLLFGRAVSYLEGVHSRYVRKANKDLENTLIEIVQTDSLLSRKITALRALSRVMDSEETVQYVYKIWDGSRVIPRLTISDRDAIALSYELAVRMPQKATAIVADQKSRLKSPNLLKEYSFVSPSVSDKQRVRDSVFCSLLQKENRLVEPWATTALAYLNHRCRDAESEKYILPGLQAVEEIKQTGDIFFSKSWVAALVGGHDRKKAKEVVLQFLHSRPDYEPMLRNKILMNIY